MKSNEVLSTPPTHRNDSLVAFPEPFDTEGGPNEGKDAGVASPGEQQGRF